MSIADNKTLRSRSTDHEALEERAQKLFTVPTEISDADFNSMDAPCPTDLNALYPLPLVDGNRVLNTPIAALTVKERYDILGCLKLNGVKLANGIKLVFVSLPNADEARLEVQFFNKNYLQRIVDKYDTEVATDPQIASRIFLIHGGHRLPAGPAFGQVQVTTIEKSADFDDPNSLQPTSLVLTVKPIGDYSTYTLSVNSNELSTKGPVVFPPASPVLIDPVFNEIDFKFRPGCFNINCAPDWPRALEPRDEPVIDYLAKDYDSFRHTMIAAMMQRVPQWETSSEADLDQVLIDLFSAAADELSDYQDRVMNEAYLASARKRVSLARHARLMDYHIHQGNQAATWLAVELDAASPTFFDIQAGLQVWTNAQDKEDAAAVVFVSQERQRVHQLFNRFGLFTWSDSIPSLMKGDTSADLKLFLNNVPVTNKASAIVVQNLIRAGVFKQLLIEERLNPATGTVNGFNPEKRQLLRLVPGKDGAEADYDPTTAPPGYDPDTDTPPNIAQWFVRVRWEEQDQLKQNYCFTIECPLVGKVHDVSLFHGNLLTVGHGRARYKDPSVLLPKGKLFDDRRVIFKESTEPLTDSNQFHYVRTRWGVTCALPDHPLAYRETPLGGDVPPRSTLVVEVKPPGAGADFWDEVPSLIHSDGSDENGDHFIVETDEEGLSWIRFGNGQNGKTLPDKAEVRCNYQFGFGPDGNVGRDKLIKFEASTLVTDPPGGDLDRCWNPFDISNGRAPEPAAEIIRRAPEAYRVRQMRAVTLQDYITRAEEIPDVSRAAARYAWTGSWRTVQVTIDPVGATTLATSLRERITRELNAVRLIGEDLEIRAPRFVPLEIHMAICARPDFWPEDLRAILEQEFSDGWTPDGRPGFFNPDSWTFGQQLKASQIIGRALAIEGVEHIISVRMKRWNNVGSFSDQITNVNFDEILQVLNDPDHMERGFIDFVIEGGRR